MSRGSIFYVVKFSDTLNHTVGSSHDTHEQAIEEILLCYDMLARYSLTKLDYMICEVYS